jgi:hypothetical protein
MLSRSIKSTGNRSKSNKKGTDTGIGIRCEVIGLGGEIFRNSRKLFRKFGE